MKITCDIISDLLPLYIDDVCTGDSKAAVDEHLADCRACRERLDAMSAEAPVTIRDRSEVAKAKKPFYRVFLHFMFWVVFAVFCTAVILVTMMYAGAFKNIDAALYHSEAFIIEDVAPTDEWTPVTSYIYSDGYDSGSLETEDYLELRGLFRSKTLDCTYPFEYKAKLRILDGDGNVVVEPFEANGGMMDIPVKELRPQTKYYVEYTTETGGSFAFNLR